MGLFQTRWEGHFDHSRRRITVTRSEWTKGFTVRIDGTVVAEQAWSWIGTGHVTGSTRQDGREVPVEVRIGLGSCNVLVDGERVPVTAVR